jgi:hypothetical protein
MVRNAPDRHVAEPESARRSARSVNSPTHKLKKPTAGTNRGGLLLLLMRNQRNQLSRDDLQNEHTATRGCIAS